MDKLQIAPLRPHFDERHDHEGVICNPQRLIITEPIVNMGALAVEAYEQESVFGGVPYLKRRLEKDFGDRLPVVTGVDTLRYGILGFFNFMPKTRFTAGDVSRATRLPESRTIYYIKRLVLDGILETEVSGCPDEVSKTRFVFMEHPKDGHKRSNFNLSGLIQTNNVG